MKKTNLQVYIFPFICLILFSLGGSSQALAGGDRIGQKIRALGEENRFLETELRLASKGRSYIILDLQTEPDSVPVRINLKNRGMTLREFDVGRTRYRRTKELAVEPILLIKKVAFFHPKRKEIRPHNPGDEADAISELDFLELKDIPSHYTLLCGRGSSYR